jgi:hypothetical protein
MDGDRIRLPLAAQLAAGRVQEERISASDARQTLPSVLDVPCDQRPESGHGTFICDMTRHICSRQNGTTLLLPEHVVDSLALVTVVAHGATNDPATSHGSGGRRNSPGRIG